jgi:hypothetical protein
MGGGQTPWGPTGLPSLGGTNPVYQQSFANQQGFIAPPQGYGVPNTQTQQVQSPYLPLSGVSPFSVSVQQPAAGYTPLSAQPNYNMMMGGTTGYKSTMK